MTEAEWHSSADPQKMLAFLRDGGPASERKLRLFGCACVRRVVRLMPDKHSHRAVEVAERFADGLAGQGELLAAWQSTVRADGDHSRWVLLKEPAVAAEDPAFYAAAATRASRRASAREAEWAGQASLLRDIFAPFSHTHVEPSWLTREALALAQAAYDERQLPEGTLDPARPAVLADALEEAGADGAILDHLRGRGPHVRGCHVLDLLLSRE
jgi:hypothetical protein